jgi:hypothetical protein
MEEERDGDVRKDGGKGKGVRVCKRLGVDIWAGRENFLIDCPGSDNLFWTPHQPEPLLGISGSISDKGECRHYFTRGRRL